MKKLTLITTIALAFMGYLIISGYKEGPAFHIGFDCTGAESDFGNPTGCSAGIGCHSNSATANIMLTLELDSAGTPVTHYKGGVNYTVKISGQNNTTHNLPRYGFQIGCITGSVQQVTPTNAGTWQSPYPTNVHYVAPQAHNFSIGIVEHDSQLLPTTGTGGLGTTYVETISWTAPAAGTGTISFWAAINCVNFNDSADASDLWNLDHKSYSEYPLAVDNLTAGNNAIKVYPNPFSLKATFSLQNELENAELSLYDITGREVKQLTFSGKEVTIDREELNTGIYFYRITDKNTTAITGRVIIQ